MTRISLSSDVGVDAVAIKSAEKKLSDIVSRHETLNKLFPEVIQHLQRDLRNWPGIERTLVKAINFSNEKISSYNKNNSGHTILACTKNDVNAVVDIIEALGISATKNGNNCCVDGESLDEFYNQFRYSTPEERNKKLDELMESRLTPNSEIWTARIEEARQDLRNLLDAASTRINDVRIISNSADVAQSASRPSN